MFLQIWPGDRQIGCSFRYSVLRSFLFLEECTVEKSKSWVDLQYVKVCVSTNVRMCVCMYVCNVRTYVNTPVYICLYVRCVYKSACLNSIFRTLIRRRWIVINTDVLLRWTDSLYCGWGYVLQVTTWPVVDCKNTLSTTEVVSRQYWEGLRKMNTVSHSRRCNSRQSKRVHSK
jgi:hypothetical protein